MDEANQVDATKKIKMISKKHEVVVTVQLVPVPWTLEREAARRTAMDAILSKLATIP
jgi:hypothetical protein